MSSGDPFAENRPLGDADDVATVLAEVERRISALPDARFDGSTGRPSVGRREVLAVLREVRVGWRPPTEHNAARSCACWRSECAECGPRRRGEPAAVPDRAEVDALRAEVDAWDAWAYTWLTDYPYGKSRRMDELRSAIAASQEPNKENKK